MDADVEAHVGVGVCDSVGTVVGAMVGVGVITDENEAVVFEEDGAVVSISVACKGFGFGSEVASFATNGEAVLASTCSGCVASTMAEVGTVVGLGTGLGRDGVAEIAGELGISLGAAVGFDDSGSGVRLDTGDGVIPALTTFSSPGVGDGVSSDADIISSVDVTVGGDVVVIDGASGITDPPPLSGIGVSAATFFDPGMGFSL